MFRTNSEIAYKNQSHYQLIGNSVHYEFHKTTIAFNTLKTSFSKPYQPFPNYYNTNYSMYKLWNNSINYRFFDGDKIVKGEVAMDQNGNLATTHFLVFKLTDAYNLMTNARFFSPKYNSFGANALSENSKVQNEKAVLFSNRNTLKTYRTSNEIGLILSNLSKTLQLTFMNLKIIYLLFGRIIL